VNCRESCERISDPIYNDGLPIIPYVGYQLKF